MTQSARPMPSAAPPPAQAPRRAATLRTIAALMLREMSTTYGRSTLGYFWAILEPVGGILLLTAIFSLAFRAPELGTSFPLFYATGMLPFVAYMDVSQKISVALRFSKQLLFYPGVTFFDTLVARFLVNALTQLMVSIAVFAAILLLSDIEVILDPGALALGFGMAFALAIGIGTLNCYLLTVYPVWERTWAILNRPLFIISTIFFTLDSLPQPYRDWLWWNPLVHVVGAVRRGVYATYDAPWVAPAYVFGIALVTFAAGLLLLRRYHSDILAL